MQDLRWKMSMLFILNFLYKKKRVHAFAIFSTWDFDLEVYKKENLITELSTAKSHMKIFCDHAAI